VILIKDIVEKMFLAVKEYFFDIGANIILWLATIVFNLVFILGEIIFNIAIMIGANAKTLNDILLSMLRLQIVQDVIYYFQLVAIALLILKGFWDLLDNYVFLSGQSTTKSATNKIMAYMFAGVMVWIIPDIVEIIVSFGGKLLSDVVTIFKGMTTVGSMEQFLGVDTASTLTDKISAIVGGGMVLGVLIYAVIIVVSIIILILTLFRLLIDFYVRAGQIMLLTVFLVPASVDLSSGSNGVFTKTLFSLVGHVISATFQYFMLMIFTYVLVFPDNVLPSYGGANFFMNTMMRLLFAYGILKTAAKTPEVIQSRLENASSGSSAAGFVDNYAMEKGKAAGGAAFGAMKNKLSSVLTK